MSIHNESNRTCYVAIGPTSPSFSVLNSKGVVVWNNCYAGAQPGACAMFMMLHPITARATFVITKTWNQRSGPASDFVARGDYTLASNLSGAGSANRIKFALV